MNRRALAIVLVLVALASRFALADGGTVLSTAERDGYRITVMTSPTPLRAGPVDVSVLVQHGDAGEIVANADVQISLNPDRDDLSSLQSTATQATATNKLFQAAILTLPEPGRWQISAAVTVDNRRFVSETEIEVAGALPQFSDLWFWAGWPAIAIGLFVAHRGLVNRSLDTMVASHCRHMSIYPGSSDVP
jgi:hypothetical protein